MQKQINLRIHHFFDIIRAFGKDEKMMPNPRGHSLHEIAELVRLDPDLKIKIVLDCDSTCKGCDYLENNHCKDRIDHRKDFISKEEFNNYIDKRIMEKCHIGENEVYVSQELCQDKAKLYLNNIDFIYAGNDDWHTELRREHFIKGLKYYKELHNL
ncbi:MAG: DUF1284 domain-containing protein [bacterium]